jgi:hypothetical protein
MEAGKEISFAPHFKGNGVYLFVIDGAVEAVGLKLGRRDAAGISDTDSITIKANEAAEVLAIEVPMVA